MKKTRLLSIVLVLVMIMAALFSYAYAADTSAAAGTATVGAAPVGAAPAGAAPGGAPPGGGGGMPGQSALAESDTSKYFTDLNKPTAAYNAYIDALYEKGLVSGTAKGIFSPGKAISRADFVLILQRNYKFADSTDNFSDVAASAYYAKALAAAKKAGVATAKAAGAEDGKAFRPAAAITREEAAVMLYAAMKAGGMPSGMESKDLSAYKDGASVLADAAEAVATLTQFGFFSAGKDGNFQPKATLTRAEMALIIYNATSMGGGGGGPSGGSGLVGHESYAGIEKLAESSAVSIEAADGAAAKVTTDKTKGALEVAEGGSVTDESVSGALITYAAAGKTGVAIDAPGAALSIGGTKGYYSVSQDAEGTPTAKKTTDGTGYNTAIILGGEGDSGDPQETFQGVGVALGGGTLTVDNAYIWTKGYRRPTLYSSTKQYDKTITEEGNIIVRNSYLESAGNENSFMPGFKLLVGSVRATLIMGEDAWFYNSKIVSRDWGALSLDATKSNLYAVNSTVQVNKGGYGTYSATDCNVEFYGVKLDSAQYGVFLCGTGKATVGSIADATAGAMKNLKKSEITSANYLQKDGSSLIAAASNAIIIHQDSGSGKTIKSMMTVKNSTITTEGVTLKDTTDYKDDKKVGASYYFINNYKGSTILMRSANADIDLENAVMGTSNGTLVQSVINYDIDAGSGIYAKDGEEFLGITVNMSGMDVKGNILHQDYQRKMTVNLKGTTLTGAAESGTMAAWNALWATCSADVQKELDHDTSYKTVWGIGMTMDKTSKWSVTKTSSLSSLTVESGAEISAPEGYKATIYENCKMDNTSTFYDYKSGTVVKSLKAGQKYTGVVIVVEKA